MNVNGDDTTWREEESDRLHASPSAARTEDTYGNFEMAEWRHSTHAGNSGVPLVPRVRVQDLEPASSASIEVRS